METEIWKVIKEAPNYEVSNMGRVRNMNGYIMKPTPDVKTLKDGSVHTWLKIGLRNERGNKIHHYVHRLVRQYFPQGDYKEVRAKEGCCNRSDRTKCIMALDTLPCTNCGNEVKKFMYRFKNLKDRICPHCKQQLDANASKDRAYQQHLKVEEIDKRRVEKKEHKEAVREARVWEDTIDYEMVDSDKQDSIWWTDEIDEWSKQFEDENCPTEILRVHPRILSGAFLSSNPADCMAMLNYIYLPDMSRNYGWEHFEFRGISTLMALMELGVDTNIDGLHISNGMLELNQDYESDGNMFADSIEEYEVIKSFGHSPDVQLDYITADEVMKDGSYIGVFWKNGSIFDLQEEEAEYFFDDCPHHNLSDLEQEAMCNNCKTQPCYETITFHTDAYVYDKYIYFGSYRSIPRNQMVIAFKHTEKYKDEEKEVVEVKTEDVIPHQEQKIETYINNLTDEELEFLTTPL